MNKDLETDGMSSHAVGALDGKHIAIKKPKKSGSEYFNYKGYFSLVLLALVDADYKFLWVNAGASGSSSDAQIFNRSKLKRRIENGTLGLPPPEPLGLGRGANLHYFLLGDNGTMPTDQRRENSQLQDIQGEKGGQELIWYTGQAIQGAVDHPGAEAKSCETLC